MNAKKLRRMSALYWMLTGLVCAAAAAILLTAVSNLQSGQTDEGKRQLEDAIRRASVACYATEGIYPPTLSYLEEHYGIQVDSSRYTVFYDVFAENLAPDVTVVENES